MSKFAAYFSNVKTYPKAFWFLNFHMLIFFASFNLLIPENNDYLASLGGADYKWLILGLWTLSAAITRPISGKIADNISRKSVMYIGVLISIAVAFTYPFLATVSGFLILRFLHGFSTGFHPTGVTALVADIIPKGKRGEAMGIFGITITLGFNLGVGMGSVVKSAFEMNGLFIVCGLLGIVSFLLIFTVEEDKEIVRQNAREKGYTSLWDKMIPKWDEVIGKEVVHPAVIMFLYASITGMYFLVVPDFSSYLGIQNKGLFFFLSLPIVIITRFVSGKFVDRIGAEKNIVAGLSVLILACLATGTAGSATHFLLSTFLFGFGTAIISPAIMAWTADMSNPVYKGRGMGTMFIMLELGFFFGNFYGQLFYDNKVENIQYAYYFAALIATLAVIYMLFVMRFTKSIYK
jgi:MFS family permease